jgi:hypothetical protein
MRNEWIHSTLIFGQTPWGITQYPLLITHYSLWSTDDLEDPQCVMRNV